MKKNTNRPYKTLSESALLATGEILYLENLYGDAVSFHMKRRKFGAAFSLISFLGILLLGGGCHVCGALGAAVDCQDLVI